MLPQTSGWPGPGCCSLGWEKIYRSCSKINFHLSWESTNTFATGQGNLHPPSLENEACNSSLKDPGGITRQMFFIFPLSDGGKATPSLVAVGLPAPPRPCLQKATELLRPQAVGRRMKHLVFELAGKQSQYLQHKSSAVLFWTRAVFPRKRLNKGSIPSRSSAPQTGEHHLGFLQDGGERCLSLENNSSQLLGIKCLTLAICKLERRFISWKNNKYGSLTASSIPPPQAWSSLLNHCHREHIKTQQDSTAITTHRRTSQSNPAVEDTSLWNRHQTEKSLKLN